MSKNLQKICVLSGPNEEVDLSRARTGITYNSTLGFKVPFRILGAGPHLSVVLEASSSLERGRISEDKYLEVKKNFDHHLSLYEALKETGEKVEAVTSSFTLVQNVLHGFQYEQDGRYAIVTEPWHYGKFERVERSLKRKRRISPRLEFFNVASPDTGYYNWLQKMASRAKTELGLMRI